MMEHQALPIRTREPDSEKKSSQSPVPEGIPPLSPEWVRPKTPSPPPETKSSDAYPSSDKDTSQQKLRAPANAPTAPAAMRSSKTKKSKDIAMARIMQQREKHSSTDGEDQQQRGERFSHVSEEQPQKNKKQKDPKIMLPGPEPEKHYLKIAAEEPYVIEPPARMLVILDLNGTLIFRPNSRKQPKRMIRRPYLKQFLRFLFDNFEVMIWSSARPQNVSVIVENALEKDQREKLFDCWARDSFGLTPREYTQNVQVYKDLNMLWDSMAVYEKTFKSSIGPSMLSQNNTILIDDSAIKAIGQPHNLLLIPEFEATEEQMKSDILKEVAGYLQTARMQANVSSFMRKHPFKADGQWQIDWAAWDYELPEEGEVKD